MIRRSVAGLVLVLLASLGLASGSAVAATTHNLVGTTWDLTCGGLCGPQTHTFDTQDASGKVTGHGSVPSGSPAWHFTGTVTGDTMSLHITYDDGSYSADSTGTINADTTKITGTFSDSAGHSNLAFVMNRLSSGSGSSDAPLPPVPGPTPVTGQSVNVAPQSGTVLVQVPGSKKFEPLTGPEQIRVGSIIDARRGRVRISINNGHGGIDTADFYEGVFRLTQSAAGSKFATLTLVGGNFKGCPHAPKAQLSGKSPGRSIRHLWGSGNGSFRTVGRFSSATIRGTTWLTDDKCSATLTRVTKGSVAVRDFVRRKTIVVKAPGKYLANPRRG